MLKKIFILISVVILVLVISGFAYVHQNKSPVIFQKSVAGLYHQDKRLIDRNSKLSITGGEIVGFSDSYETFAWLGIPYAQAPVGELRWKAPRPAISWQSEYQAIDYGPPCVQFGGSLSGIDSSEGKVVGSEDCLSLNIWAPKSALKSANKLPVMYWIHGGGNDSGSSRIFQGHHLAGEKNVVVVTINYRLGMLGWFSHDSIRDLALTPEDASGNFGTLDIIQGLKWVQNNIEQFGGDPNNVTIFGESAGGRNVYSLLASPLAKNLFHRAISQSGTPDTTVLTLAEDYDDKRLSNPVFGLKNSSNGLISLVLSEQYPNKSTAEIRQQIASYSPQDLLRLMRDVEAEKLMTLASNNSSSPTYIQVARVLRDGYVLPKTSTLELLKNLDSFNNVPLMLGTNRDEQKLFMARNPRYVEQFLGVFPKPKNELYYNRVSEYVSDNWKAGAVDEPATLITNAGGQVYAYRFDWDESPSNFLIDLPTLLGAAHGLEINFVFGDFEGGVPLGPLLDKDNAKGRQALSATMMDYWAEFAHSGNPGRGYSGIQTPWLAWNNQGPNLMVLDTESDGGTRMEKLSISVADIKARLSSDAILNNQRERCEAYAVLFLHGYQSSDFWNPKEYSELGCDEFPAGEFRAS